MTKDTKLSELVINKMTTAQYEALEEKDPNQLYIVTDGTLSGFDLFDHKWEDHILDDMSWLRADTFSWQDGEKYKSAYNHLVDEFLSGQLGQSETIAGVTIYYNIAPDGHKIVDASYPAEVQHVEDIYNATGVAWYYILDVTNKRFKLPRELPITDKSKGNGMTLGLTDGTNNYGMQIEDSNINEALLISNQYGTNVGTASLNTTNTIRKTVGITTDPTKSGIISHRANENGQQHLYFYVGQSSQSAIEQTAGLNSELFNSKVDLDGHNAAFAHIVESYRNGSSWYRVYSNGRVEQGGSFFAFSSIGANTASETTLNLILQMANTDYTFNANGSCDNYSAAICVSDRKPYRTVSSLLIGCRNFNNGSANNVYVDWEVKGYKA